MRVTIRPERYKDFGAIAEINAEVFYSNGYVGESALIDSLRHGIDFDPELSLVAEVDGAAVGHGIFYPMHIRLGRETLRAVCVGPIGVLPSYQNQGIGRALMESGHKIAREKGCKFSFLYGDPDYFARFGYQKKMFGYSSVEVDISCVRGASSPMVEREVVRGDLPELLEMWELWYGHTDLSICPGSSLVEWISHYPLVRSSCFLIDGKLKGFIRYCLGDREEIRLFMAKDKKSAMEILRHYKCSIARGGRVVLPLHPDSPAMSLLQGCGYHAELDAWSFGMIKLLDEGCTEVRDYCQGVLEGKRKPGRITYPPYYDMV